jgi:hypothetical protein
MLWEIVEEEYSNWEAEEQSGFYAGHSCMDNYTCYL